MWALQVGQSQARIDPLARHILEVAPETAVLTSGPAVAITAAPSGLSIKPASQNTRAPVAPKPTDLRAGSHQRP